MVMILINYFELDEKLIVDNNIVNKGIEFSLLIC